MNDAVLSKNENCNRPLVDDSFFEALSAFEPADIKAKNCYITADYVSAHDETYLGRESLFYDCRMQKVVQEEEWNKCCFAYTMAQKQDRLRALEKHGLLDAYNALEAYLKNHATLETTICVSPQSGGFRYETVRRNLTYGYKLAGFEWINEAILWRIETYERPIKENDCIRGQDYCYLEYKDGIIYETSMLCGLTIGNKSKGGFSRGYVGHYNKKKG